MALVFHFRHQNDLVQKFSERIDVPALKKIHDQEAFRDLLFLLENLYRICQSGSVFVTAASFLNIAAKTGIVNLSEIYYYEILANKHHLNSP